MFGKKKYNHKKKNIYDACGLDKKKLHKKLKELRKKLYDMLDGEKIEQSRCIEVIEESLTKREMALTLYSYSLQLIQDKEDDYDKAEHVEFR